MANAISVYTHDRIELASSGLMSKATLLYGGNALQTINVTRNTPRNPQQAIGFLGVVDYTRGIITSDVTLDCILVEACTDADDVTNGGTNSINVYAAKTIDIGTETYALTSFSAALAAGSPATCNYGWITGTLASYLATQAQPTASVGADFAVVMGDEGQGVDLIATWAADHTPVSGGTTTTTIPVLDTDGSLTAVTDNGIPAGVQSLNISTNVNRDQVLDVRTSLPVAFVTTYPVDIRLEMEIYQMPGTNPPTEPGASAWKHLTGLTVQQRLGTTPKKYFIIKGLTQISEGESVSVGRYLSYTTSFEASDLFFPITVGTVS